MNAAREGLPSRRASALPLPKEHGSWVMLAVAFLAGAGAAGRLTPALLLYLVAFLAIFILRRPASLLLRGGPGASTPEERRLLARWLVALAIAGGAAALGLLALGLWLMIPLGIAALALLAVDLRRAVRTARPTLASELAGAAGIALGAPGSYYAASGALDGTAFALWLLSALYFASGVFYIRMKARWVKEPPSSPAARWASGRDTVLYHAAALAVAAAASAAGYAPPLAWVSLLPVTARRLYATARGQRETDFRRLGYVETAHSLVFLALLLILL